MAFAGIMVREDEIDQKTGANVSVGFTDVMKTAATSAAESTVNVVCRYNFSDKYDALNSDVRYILTDVVSSLVAIEGLAYYVSGSRVWAEDKINICRDGALRGLSILRDKKAQDFINDA